MSWSRRLRAIARVIYHLCPLRQDIKWRLRERLDPLLQVLQDKPTLKRILNGFSLAILGRKEMTIGRDNQRERALLEIIEYIADHTCSFGQPTHWLALPFLTTGGAEKFALNLCRALRELRPTHSVVLLVTDRNLVTKSVPIPSGVALVIFDDYLSDDLSYERKQTLLRDLLLVARPQCFLNINSEVAWLLILADGQRLGRLTFLYASIFAFQFAPDGRTKIGYAAYFLKKAMPFLTGLLSDNQRFIEDAVAEYGFDPEIRSRMHVLYQPCTFVDGATRATVEPRSRTAYERPQILWAGRLDAEKRVDLFLDVVRRCTFADFRVYGQVVLDGDKTLPTLPNLSYEGPFSSPLQWVEHFDFNAFLFTSKWEGMPNILLEAGALGIPVIAPTVGGVGELISDETGYPLPEHPTVEDYERTLCALLADPVGARARSDRLLQLLNERHNWRQFISALTAVPGFNATAHPPQNIIPPPRKSDEPLVSVIIPCYNQGRYLYESVSSALAACSSDMEIIIVDDGSTDPKIEHYLREANGLALDIVRVCRMTNGGLSSARNAGLELARGEFIQFLDADDLLTPGKIDAQLAQLTVNKKLDVSVCNFLLCDETRSHFSKPDEAIARFDLSLEDFLYRWERGFSIPIHCGLFRKKLLSKTRFDTHSQAKEDWLFWTSLSISGASLGYINGHWAIYRQHDASMRQSYLNMGHAWLRAGLKIESMLGGREPLFIESVVSWFEQCYRANPGYQEEIAALQVASSGKAGVTIGPGMPVLAEASVCRVDPVRLIDRLKGIGSTLQEEPPMISVVIPVYNHYDYLEGCLDSLAEQRNVPFEIVCVDDASSDFRVTELMRALSNRLPHLKVIIQSTNQGISRAQNDAVAVATGEFVAFLDCDDALEPGALAVIRDYIQAYPEMDYFFTDRLDVDETGKVVRTARYGGYEFLHFRGQEHIRSDLLDGMVASHLKVIRRSAYLAAGGCDEALSGVQDWALALTIAEDKSLYYVNQALYRHRLQASSVTRGDSVAQFRKTNILRRRFAERWLRTKDFDPKTASIRVFKSGDFPLSLDQLKTAWREGARCIVNIFGPLEISRCNFLREFNSYFDEIQWDDPAVPASLIGYLWSDSLLMKHGDA